MENNNEVPELVDGVELRRMFKISLNTMYKWRRAGMPVIQPAGPKGKYYFSKAEVIAWARNRAKEGEAK